MIDRRSKMIDNSRFVYECLICRRRLIGDLNTDPRYCPMCKERTKDITLVIIDNMVVRK